MERSEHPGAEPDELPTEQDETAEEAGGEGPINEAERVVDAEPGGPPAEPEPEDEDELTVAQRERGEYLALAQRTQADFENYRKRAARDAAAAGERAKSGLVRELLPVVDNLERALDAANAGERGDGQPAEHLADGVRLVHSELVAVLARNGVEAFDPRGEKFDPELHEALSMRSEEGAEAGTVLDVVEKGYRLSGAVLRPARVVVSG
jgi:molecular chaperone GrpE